MAGNQPLMHPGGSRAVDAKGFAGMFEISIAMVYRLRESGRCPAPVRIGRGLRWRVDELEAWLAAGCPPRSRWQAAKWSKKKAAELRRLKQKPPEATGGSN